MGFHLTRPMTDTAADSRAAAGRSRSSRRPRLGAQNLIRGPTSNRILSSKYRDQTGLCYYGHRCYAPAVGRWLSRDPVTENGWIQSFGADRGYDSSDSLDDLGLALFVLNNPANSSDAVGLQLYYRCARCGPDITAHLRQVIAQVARDYSTWSRITRWFKCKSLDTPPFSAGAWDIVELSPSLRYRLNSVCSGCPTPACDETVAVDGECFRSYRVNYVLFGTQGRLCGWTLIRTLTLVAMWKRVVYGHPMDADTAAWTIAGFNGWPRRAGTPPTLLQRGCQTDCCRYMGPSFGYIWTPRGRRRTGP
jgi:RHS repeat-associated protein